MTDQIQEVIDMLSEDDVLIRSRLESLLPKPRTLADELRALDGKETRYGHLMAALNGIADRVETIEQERDEAQAGGRAAADNWTNTARRLEEAQAEIARLRGRDNDDDLAPEPGHPTHLKTAQDYQNAPIGTIVQMEAPGWAHFIKDDEGCWATKGFIGYYTSESMSGTPCVVVKWGTEHAPTPEPERIDPASCGRHNWYLIEVYGEARHGIRIDTKDGLQWHCIGADGFCCFASDGTVRVIRPLTSEEMDAR